MLSDAGFRDISVYLHHTEFDLLNYPKQYALTRPFWLSKPVSKSKFTLFQKGEVFTK